MPEGEGDGLRRVDMFVEGNGVSVVKNRGFTMELDFLSRVDSVSSFLANILSLFSRNSYLCAHIASNFVIILSCFTVLCSAQYFSWCS